MRLAAISDSHRRGAGLPCPLLEAEQYIFRPPQQNLLAKTLTWVSWYSCTGEMPREKILADAPGLRRNMLFLAPSFPLPDVLNEDYSITPTTTTTQSSTTTTTKTTEPKKFKPTICGRRGCSNSRLCISAAGAKRLLIAV